MVSHDSESLKKKIATLFIDVLLHIRRVVSLILKDCSTVNLISFFKFLVENFCSSTLFMKS